MQTKMEEPDRDGLKQFYVVLLKDDEGFVLELTINTKEEQRAKTEQMIERHSRTTEISPSFTKAARQTARLVWKSLVKLPAEPRFHNDGSRDPGPLFRIVSLLACKALEMMHTQLKRQDCH